jgi:hypothetical protein
LPTAPWLATGEDPVARWCHAKLCQHPIFYNSIIYGNQSGISNSNGGNFIAHYSLIQGETSIVNNNLDGNINNPQYVSTVDFTLAPTTAGNYRLQTGSVV